MPQAGQPIPGRECGPCTVCCVVPPIETPELSKPSGLLCRHCAENRGCRIYEARPRLCRDFFCGWRLLPQLDQTWRPDLSGVMILPEDEDIPDAYEERPGLKLLLTVSARPILWPTFASYVAGLVEARVPVFLAVPGPAGFHFAKAFLNDHLAGAVAARDGGEMIRIMAAVVDRLRQGAFDAVAPAPSRTGPSI